MVEYDLGLVRGSDGAKGDKGDKGDKGAKGDDGKGITSILKTGSSGKVDTYTITYSDGSTSTFTVTNGSDGSVTVDSALSSTSVNPVQNKVIKGALDGKSDTGHTHTKSNITDFAHTHDDRYYTESETDNLLSGKASSSHSHTESDITNLGDYIEKSSTNGLVKNDGSIMTSGTGANNWALGNHTHKKLEKTEITTGTLDDFTATGWYSYSSGNSANITNVPEVVGSVMEVLDDYGDGKYVIQKVYTLPSDKNSVVWYRQKYYNNGWGSWKKLMSDSDIVDNLTTNDATKVLSAKQGKVLNDLIGDAILFINGTGGS